MPFSRDFEDWHYPKIYFIADSSSTASLACIGHYSALRFLTSSASSFAKPTHLRYQANYLNYYPNL
jgi:hypothetical protein